MKETVPEPVCCRLESPILPPRRQDGKQERQERGILSNAACSLQTPLLLKVLDGGYQQCVLLVLTPPAVPSDQRQYSPHHTAIQLVKKVSFVQ